MANANGPFGLIPRRHASGSHYNASINKYAVAAADGTALFRGDPVVVTGAGDAATGCAVVTRAGATGAITGVVVGFDSALVSTGYRPASTLGYVLVNDDPDTLYEVQDNANGGVVMDGANANLAVGAGNIATKQSAFVLDSSTATTTATLQVKVMRAQERVDNDPTTANGKWLVKINNSTVAPNTAGI